MSDDEALEENKQRPGFRGQAQISEERLLHYIAALLITLSAMLVVWNLQDSSRKNANTGSRYATVESLVDYGTYSINKSKYVRTIDKYKTGKDFISSKPPVLPTYAAGTYWVYKKLTGKTIADHEGSVVRFVSLMTGGLFHVVFLIFFYRLCLVLMSRHLAIIGSLAAAAFAFLGVGYATSLNNHSTGAALVIVGLYYAVRVRVEDRVKDRHWVFSGLALGFASAIDLPSAIFLPLTGIYLGTHNWRKALLLFGAATLPGIVTQVSLNYSITDSWKPPYINRALKDFPEFHWKSGRRSGIDALKEPKHIYAFNMFFGHHGLFSMTPLTAIGAYELLRKLWHRERLREGLLIGVGTFVIVNFYLWRTRNYGGWCVGMRHLVPIMPLLLLYFGLWLDRVRINNYRWTVVVVAFAVSSFHVQDALSSPWQFSRWHNFLEGRPNRNRLTDKLNLGDAHSKKRKRAKQKKRRKKSSKKNVSKKRRRQTAKPIPQTQD